jgi:phenylpyruvate tautomerase
MPYVSIQTNQSIPAENQNALLAAVSDLVSSQLGKPEEYVMAAIIQGSSMIFARDRAPSAFVELSSIGVPDEKRNPLCSGLTELISVHAAIPSNRIYVVLADISPRLWGYQGKTFR